jgi:hypothetical protein
MQAMRFGDGNEKQTSRDEFLSGPRILIEQLRERQLALLGGQDLRGSGFENEEPDPDYSEEV